MQDIYSCCTPCVEPCLESDSIFCESLPFARIGIASTWLMRMRLGSSTVQLRKRPLIYSAFLQGPAETIRNIHHYTIFSRGTDSLRGQNLVDQLNSSTASGSAHQHETPPSKLLRPAQPGNSVGRTGQNCDITPAVPAAGFC
jgi:hypothetical protein